MKVPYIGPGLAAEHIKALFAALPQLLEQFRQAVRRDAVEGSELTRRLPEALVEAFTSLR
jgi:hypothetical protein